MQTSKHLGQSLGFMLLLAIACAGMVGLMTSQVGAMP
ncbi:hypothetical protein O77CONTIG1_01387 [Leptolyngbya sp. O-77]|jgi:hypothetical protein|nr:hypothetical protein O77CONTIG1_01387 [Leptolyngbya sp. O-77]